MSVESCNWGHPFLTLNALKVYRKFILIFLKEIVLKVEVTHETFENLVGLIKMLFWNSPTYVFVIFYNVTIPHLLSQKLDFKYIVLYLTSNHTELCPDVKFGPKCIAVVSVLQSICLVCPLTSMLTNTNSQYFTYLIFGMVNDPTLNINPIDCKQTTPVLYTCVTSDFSIMFWSL